MREFILWARRSPSTPDFSLDELHRAGRLTNLAQCIVNALFYSNQIRPHTQIHMVLGGSAVAPRTVRIESDTLQSLRGFDDRSVCGLIQQALRLGRRIHRGEEVEALPGVFVVEKSFETLIREKSTMMPLYFLHRKGEDIRSHRFPLSAGFVCSDHLAMPKKTERFLIRRLNSKRISVGPKTLFSSQCIALVHNELDRQSIL